MNKKDRKELAKAQELIEEAHSIIDDLSQDIQGRADNLYDTNFTRRLEELELEASEFDEIAGDLEMVIEKIEDMLEGVGI